MTMLRVGLTGSIGVGKSYVAGILSELGCHVLDADLTARAVVAPGSPGLSTVVAAFGREVLRSDGSLDRQKLASVVFSDDKKRELLNSILHPFIITKQDEQLREWEDKNPNGIAVVDAALMIESGGYKRFDKLVVVHCRPEVQLERVMNRNGLSRAEARKRMDAQMTQEMKQTFADYLIDTSDGFEATRKQTEELFKELARTKE